MVRLACAVLFALCLAAPVFSAPAAGKDTKAKAVKSTDSSFQLKSHYKVVTIPDGTFVIKNGTGFSGPYVSAMDAFADAGNFTYDITEQADKNFGKKQADGKFNGMIGDTASGIYDIILTNIAFTKDIAAVLSGAVAPVNVTEDVYFNPKMKSDKKDYVVQKNIDYFLLKNSDDPAAKAIWANINGRKPASIVASIDDGVKQAKAGKYFITADDSVADMVDASKGTLAKDSTSIDPKVPVYPFATKKRSDIGLFLDTILAILLGDDETVSDAWASEIVDTLIDTGVGGSDTSKK